MLVLTAPFAFSNPDSTGSKLDSIVIVLDERVRQNAEKTETKIQAIDDVLRVRTDSLDSRLDVYLGIATFLFALLGLIGWVTVRSWAKSRIEKMVDSALKRSLGDFKTQAGEQMRAILAKQEAKGEKQLKVIKGNADMLFDDIGSKAVAKDSPINTDRDERLADYAKQLVQSKTENEYTAKDWFLRGVAAAERNDPEAAVFYFTQSIKLDPTRTKSYNNRGNAFRQLGRFEEALRDYDKAVEVDPKNATALANKAGALGEMGKNDDALDVGNRAIEIDPNHPMAYLNRGSTAADQGRFEDAMMDFVRAIRIDPMFALAYCNRGTTQKVLGHLDDALTDLSSAIRIDPEFAEAYNGRGNVYKAMNKNAEALNDYNEAVRLRPSMTAAYMNRGLLFQGMGRLSEALDDFQYALMLAPDDSAVYLMVAEVAIQLNEYETALKRASEALSVSEEPDAKAVSLYLKVVTEQLLRRDTSTTETSYEKALQEDFETSWSTAEIEGWVETADIAEDAREFIKAKTESLKAKKKKE
jgi:tetratricopeptide (TPR) repeat protein